MAKATVSIDGTEREVDLPEGYLSPKEIKEHYVHKDNVEASIASRVSRAKRDARTALKDDDEFKTEVLDSYGITLGEDGTPKLPAGMDAEAVKQQVDIQVAAYTKKADKELAKTKEELGAKDKALQSLHERLVDAEIIRAGKALGVKDAHFQTLPGAPKASAPILQQTRHHFRYDPETDQVVRITANGDPVLSSDKGRTYEGVADFFAELKTDDSIAEGWFEKKKPTETLLGTPGVFNQQTPLEDIVYQARHRVPKP